MIHNSAQRTARARACGGLAIGLLALLLASAARAAPKAADTAKLEALMAHGVPLVDVRTRGEWQETGVVEGAHLMTFFDEKGQYDWHGWLGRLQEIAGPDQPLVLMCDSGVRSALIAKALSDQAGYVTVYDYKPGIAGWLRDRRPTVQAPPTE